MGHGAGILLLTAVAGYWVLERADTHKGDLKRVGKVLGWLIIVVSIAGVACNVWYVAKYRSMYCPLPKRGGYCPMSPQVSPPPSQPD